MWWLRIGRDISAVEFSPEVQGVPDPHWAHHPRVPVPRRGISTTSGCENQQGLHPGEMKSCCTHRSPLKGPEHRSNGSETLGLSSTEHAKHLWDLQGGTESSGCRTRAEGAALSGSGVQAGASKPSVMPQSQGARLGGCAGRQNCSFVEPFPHMAGR